MFDVDYTTILRQGDVALVPLSRKPVVTVVESQDLVVGDTYTLTAEVIVRNGNHTYALNPHLCHERGEHVDLCGDGWFKVDQAKSYARPERRRFGRATYD